MGGGGLTEYEERRVRRRTGCAMYEEYGVRGVWEMRGRCVCVAWEGVQNVWSAERECAQSIRSMRSRVRHKKGAD